MSRRLFDASLLAVTVVVTTVVSTWPYATEPLWDVPRHQDPLFSTWRLYQWSRNLFGSASDWTGGNIFYPARDVLFYSDAIPLPAFLAAPWIHAGVPPVVAYNALVFLSFLTAGCGMYLFARDVTGHRGGALVAAVIFTGAPYRIEHLVHLEMLWTCWIPLAFWAARRVLAGHARSAGWLAAALVAQFLCCVYYGLFLVTVLPVVAGIAWLARPVRVPRAAVAGLGLALAVTVVAVALYSLPYQRVRATLGDRSVDEIETYGATAGSYLATPEGNWLWGWTADSLGRREARLSPGLSAWILAAPALLPPLQPWALGLAAGAVFSADASRGMDGVIYPLLLRFVSPYGGLRVPARFAAMVLACIAALAAIGVARIDSVLGRPRWGPAVAALAVAVLLAEYATTTTMRHLPDEPPTLAAWLAAQPPTVIAHMPMPRTDALPGAEADFQYFAQYHRHELVNGNSGHYPPEYLALLERVRGFPDARAIHALREAGVTLVILHDQFYPQGAYGAAVIALQETPGVRDVAALFDDAGAARVFRIAPE